MTSRWLCSFSTYAAWCWSCSSLFWSFSFAWSDWEAQQYCKYVFICCVCFIEAVFGLMHQYAISGCVLSCCLPLWSSQTWRQFVRLPRSAPCSAYCSRPAELGSSPAAQWLSLLTLVCSRGTQWPLTSFVFLIGHLEFLHRMMWRTINWCLTQRALARHLHGHEAASPVAPEPKPGNQSHITSHTECFRITVEKQKLIHLFFFVPS